MTPCLPRRRNAATIAIVVALTTGALPAAAGAAEEPMAYDHSQTIVVGPHEQPFSAASTGSTDDDAIVFNGRGSYHSIGMSQYGAYEQGLPKADGGAGRTAAQILTTYFQGTSVEAHPIGHDIRVGVVRDTPRIRVKPRGGSMDLRFNDPVSFVGARDQTWTVTPTSDGKCRTADESGVRHTGGCPTFDPRPGTRIDVLQPNGDSWKLHGTYGRDAVVDIVTDQLASGGWRIDTVVQIPLEQYLYGLAEVPYSWPTASLQAQAIAGRSYAMSKMITGGKSPDGGCSCHVWDTQRDQVYRGHERETSARWADWKAAVDATARKVVVAEPDQAGYDETARSSGVVQAFYSASSHGRTENKHEVWSPTPWDYMVSVKDDWSLEAEGNPYASWSRPFSRDVVAARVGLPSVDSVQVTERRESGSARTVVFRGGGKSVTLSGDEVRWKFGLLSNGFGIGDEQWDGYTPPPPSDLFTDDDGNVHEASIDWLANRRITVGCNPPDNTRYCPNEAVTRAQMATFLSRALELDPGSTGRFSDVAAGSTHERTIGALAKAGITVGCNPPDNTRFCPYEAVTRAQMATFISRAMELGAGPTGRFTDVAAGSTHERTIGALAKAGITQGCNPPDNTRYCPQQSVTRAQMATFLYRALG